MTKRQRPTEWDVMRPSVVLAGKQLCELVGLTYYHPDDAHWIAECIKAGNWQPLSRKVQERLYWMNKALLRELAETVLG